MNRTIIGALAAVGIAVAGMAQAEDFMPAVVFDMGGKFDKSFNEAAFNGAERFKADSGIQYRDFEVTNPSMREQALRNMARRGAQVVVAMGFAQAAAVETVAQEFPDTKFTLIDMVVDLPNVQSVIFKEHEGSFLVGMAAALASETGKVGFVGGMDIPLIRKFALGYVEGAKHINPDIEIYQNMTGTTPSAWNDPTRGGELARSQFDRGADVVYAAAGGTGIGVYQAAKDAGKLAIGVDSNQNYMHPGTMLTSMIKRVDVAVYEVLPDRPGGHLAGRHPDSRPRRGRGRLGPRRAQPQPHPGRGGGGDRAGARGHHRRQDRGDRLHGAIARGRGRRRPPSSEEARTPWQGRSSGGPPEKRGPSGAAGVRPRSKPSASRNGSARCTPTTTCRSPWRRARSTASSARTAPASRP